MSKSLRHIALIPDFYDSYQCVESLNDAFFSAWVNFIEWSLESKISYLTGWFLSVDDLSQEHETKETKLKVLIDFMPRFIDLCLAQNIKIFFIGNNVLIKEKSPLLYQT